MPSRNSYVPPVNPDSRPLPAGWTQHYDPQRKLWIYLDMNILPPLASLIHPAGPITASPTGPASSPASASSSPNPHNSQPSSKTPYANAIQAARERQEKTLAQQLYSSALPRKHQELQPSASGAPARTHSPDYQLEDAAPAYGSIDPSTFAYSPAVAWTAATGARSTSSHVSQASTSSSTSSGSRRPLPTPPSQFSSSPHPTSPPVSPPPFPDDTEGVLQPTPLRADIKFGVKTNLAETLLQAIPEGDTTPSLSSGIRDHGQGVKDYASGLRSKPPSYSAIMQPLALREKMGMRPPPLLGRNDDPTPSTSTTTYLGSVHPHSTRRRSGGVAPLSPRDDSELIPPDSARTITSFDPSPIYSSGMPEGSFPVPHSRPTSLEAPPKPISPTLPPKSASSPTPSSSSPAPSQISNKPPRNAFAPREIMAIAARNMQASTSSAHYTDLFDPSSLYSGKYRSAAPSPQPNTPSPGPVDGQATLDMLQHSDGVPDPSATSHSSTSCTAPRVRPASRDLHPTEAPWSAFFPSAGSISGDNENSTSESAKKEGGMGGKIKKFGSGFSKAAGKGLAALKRPSVAGMRSSSKESFNDGVAETSREGSLSLPSSDHLPSLIEEVKIVSPTLGEINLPLDSDSGRHSTSQPSSSQPTSHDFHGMTHIQGSPNAKPVVQPGTSQGGSGSRSDLSSNSSHSSKSPHIPALRALDTSAYSSPLHPPPSQKGARAVNILASLGPKHEPPHRPPRGYPTANISARLDALGPQHPPLQMGRPSATYSNASTPSMSSSGTHSSASKHAVSKAAMIFGHYGQR